MTNFSEALAEVWSKTLLIELENNIKRIVELKGLLDKGELNKTELGIYLNLKEISENGLTGIINLLQEADFEKELYAPQPIKVFLEGGEKRLIYEGIISNVKDFYNIHHNVLKEFGNELKGTLLEEYLIELANFSATIHSVLVKRLESIDIVSNLVETVIKNLKSLMLELKILPKDKFHEELLNSLNKIPVLISSGIDVKSGNILSTAATYYLESDAIVIYMVPLTFIDPDIIEMVIAHELSHAIMFKKSWKLYVETLNRINKLRNEGEKVHAKLVSLAISKDKRAVELFEKFDPVRRWLEKAGSFKSNIVEGFAILIEIFYARYKMQNGKEKVKKIYKYLSKDYKTFLRNFVERFLFVDIDNPKWLELSAEKLIKRFADIDVEVEILGNSLSNTEKKLLEIR